MSDPLARRTFFLPAAGAAAAARAQTTPANSRIQVGLIGVGNLGLRHLRDRLLPLERQKQRIRIAAACDIYTKARERARALTGLGERDVPGDYREMIARRDVDAVIIVTPEHLHHRMAMDALRAGKDVYIEKPMTYTIPEAAEIAACTASSGRVLQVGSQYVSDPRNRLAREVIGKGWIGKVVWAQVSTSQNSVHGIWQYFIEPEATEKTIDWPAFLGPAPKRPFSAERYFRWRKYWDYSGGIASDLLYHNLSAMMTALGPRFPVRVSATGGIYVFLDREVPDTYSMSVEYENFQVCLAGSAAAAAGGRFQRPVIYGHEGTIEFVRGGIEVRPEPTFAAQFRKRTGQDVARLEAEPKDPDVIRFGHMENFLDCMKSRAKPVFDAEFGYQVMTAIKLGVDSYRQSRLMAFDPRTRRVIEKAPPRPGFEGTGENYDEPGTKLPDGRRSG